MNTFRKRAISVILCVSVLCGLAAQTSAAPVSQTIEAVFGKTKFTLNGAPLNKDSLLYDGAAYLPAAYFANTLGLHSAWDAKTNVTNLFYAFAVTSAPVGSKTLDEPVTKTINVTFGAPVYYLNGTRMEADCLTYNGEAYLPASFLARSLGVSADWNPATNITELKYVPVTQVAFPRKVEELPDDGTMKLEPVVYPSNATFKALSYVSENPDIAAVDENGVVRGLKEGDAVIKCTTVNGLTDRVIVSVGKTFTGVVIAFGDRFNFRLGESLKLDVEVYADSATGSAYTVTVVEGAASLSGDTVTFTTSGIVKLCVTAENGDIGFAWFNAIDMAPFAEEATRLINEERAKNGLKPLLPGGAALDACADLRASEIMTVFAHDRPNGTSCFTAFAESGAVYTKYAGENLANGYDSPSEVVLAWLASPEHRKNILNPNFNHMSIGVLMDDKGIIYWAQEFTD